MCTYFVWNELQIFTFYLLQSFLLFFFHIQNTKVTWQWNIVRRWYGKKLYYTIYFIYCTEASRGAVAQSVTVEPTGCGFDPHSRRGNIYLNLYFHFFALVLRQSTALSSATQHPMPPEFGRKWGTGRHTRFPLPTLLCAGYSVQLIYFIYFK